MKKSKAIAIFCVLFIILLVLVVSTSNYLGENNIDRKNMLAANVEGAGGGGSGKEYIGIIIKSDYVSPSQCDTSDGTGYIGKRKVYSKDLKISMYGCAYDLKGSTPSIKCPNNASEIINASSYERNNPNNFVRMYLCIKDSEKDNNHSYTLDTLNDNYYDVMSCGNDVDSSFLGTYLIYNKDKSVSKKGCVFKITHKTSTISCLPGSSVKRYSGYDSSNNNNIVTLYLCAKDSSSSSNNGIEGSTDGGTNSNQVGSNQSSAESTSTQGAGKESGTVKSGICDEPRLKYNNLCASEGFKTASKIAGTIILFAKWIAPLLLMILGMVDFGKAFLSGDDKSLTDATTAFIKRLVIAIIIPIVPSLLYYLIGFFTGEENPNKDENFISCTDCLKYPLDEEKCNVTKYNYDRCKK